MKIIRYRDSQSRVGYGWQGEEGGYYKIAGDIFGEYTAKREAADVAKLLAPVAPSGFFCIGLNYRQHAAETTRNASRRMSIFQRWS